MNARRRIANFGMYLAGFAGVVNITVVYLALPYIERALHAGLADQEWIVSIYPLMEGGFTLAAGTLGDLYGRKRTLTVMGWIFVLSTLGCALAPSAPALIVLRAFQGLGGAALLSLPVAVLIQMLPEGADHEETIKSFSTVAGAGGIAGPVIGGILVHWWGWPAVFYASVVMGIVMLASMPFVTETPRDRSIRLDGLGQFLCIVSFVAISFALIEGNANGWASPAILAAFGVFACGIAAFIAVERRVKQPMIHLRYFASRPFAAGVLIVGMLNLAWYGIMLLCTDFLQNVQHQNAFAAGLFMMPSNLAFFIVNNYCETVEKRIGQRALLVISSFITLIGIVWMAVLSANSSPWNVAGGLLVAGIGWGLLFSPAAAMTMDACEGCDQGFASGVVSLSRSLFGVFGIAVLGSILASGMARGIASGLSAANASPAAMQAIGQAVHHGGAFTIVAHPPAGIPGAMLGTIVRHGFVNGWHAAMLVCAVLIVLITALVFGLIPARRTAAIAPAPSS